MAKISGETPKSVMIEARFRTFDETKPRWNQDENSQIYDSFIVEIVGSGEDLASFCDYTGISIEQSSRMAGSFNNVLITSDSDWTPQEFWISTEILGLEALSEECRSLVHMTVEAEQPSRTYLQQWSSRPEDMMM
jgi:hypothetical protein